MLDRAQLDNELNGAHQANFVRYAIYYTPLPGSPLAAFGRSWFGRANDGATLQAFSDAGLTGAAAAKPLAGSSRYSGLHAVFKAPFCLREGMGPDALKARLISFAARVTTSCMAGSPWNRFRSGSGNAASPRSEAEDAALAGGGNVCANSVVPLLRRRSVRCPVGRECAKRGMSSMPQSKM